MATPDSLVVDVHVHSPAFLPTLPRRIYRWFLRRTIPSGIGLAEAHRSGVDAFVVKAVGDSLVTRLQLRSRFRAVRAQLRRLRVETLAARGEVVTDVAGLEAAAAEGRSAIILGLEGADAIGRDLNKLDALWTAGVRVVVPVHLGNNRIGTTTLPWQGYVNIPFRHSRTPGLTQFGSQVIRRMNRLGMVIDVSHADTPTLLDIVAQSQAPVIASHSGARGVTEWERYLTDQEIIAVAGTGGVIGLWPYRFGGEGVATMGELVRHAQHIAGLVGPEHICIGTDMNGVPGVMQDAGGAGDVAAIRDALLAAGFTAAEVRGITGANFLRVFAQVTAPAARLLDA